jgi:glutamate synthase domain-containing protein 2
MAEETGLPVGIKSAIGKLEQWEELAAYMVKTNSGPDFITIDGAEGGTGAAPVEYSNYIGTPLEAGLVFVHNALVGVNVRDKIKIICSGKITNGFDILKYLALGADLCNSALGMMMATGCLQSKQCNANTCPTGIATQDKRLQYGLVVDTKKVNVAHFHKNTIKSFQEMVGALGLSNPGDLKPFHIMRRVAETDVRSFNKIYDYLQPGALLGKEIPESYKEDWNYADPDQFP